MCRNEPDPSGPSELGQARTGESGLVTLLMYVVCMPPIS